MGDASSSAVNRVRTLIVVAATSPSIERLLSIEQDPPCTETRLVGENKGLGAP